MGKKIRKLLKDLSGPSPLVNLFFKTKTKKITVVQYQNENEKRRRERRPIKTPPMPSSYPKTNSCSATVNKSIYRPNPLCTLVLGTAPWRNSSFEFMRMSWFPATISTPSLIFLMKGLVVVDTTDMENSAVSPPWYSSQCRHSAFVLFFFCSPVWCSPPLVYPE